MGVVSFGLEGQAAIVTGAARGIGLGISRRLAAEGVHVIGWDKDPAPIAEDHAFVHTETVDVTDETAVAKGFERSLERPNGIDILVNNAGVNGPTRPSWTYSLADWNRVVAVDMTGVFLCCRAVAPHMRERGYGRIITIASVVGKEGNANACAYSAAKAGVIGFMKGLAKELVGTGVTVNSVAPAMTETDFLGEMTADYIETVKAKIPMGRLCTVGEIADMVAWVASPQCSFTTGAVFDLSGGRATY